jgi:hypothetical protein
MKTNTKPVKKTNMKTKPAKKSQMTCKGNSKTKIMKFMFRRMDKKTRDDYEDPRTHKANDKQWTPADLFIRQYLNNLSDGFGMKQVVKVYEFLCKHKTILVGLNLVSKNGVNNSGYQLWKDYDFVVSEERMIRNREFAETNDLFMSALFEAATRQGRV